MLQKVVKIEQGVDVTWLVDTPNIVIGKSSNGTYYVINRKKFYLYGVNDKRIDYIVNKSDIKFDLYGILYSQFINDEKVNIIYVTDIKLYNDSVIQQTLKQSDQNKVLEKDILNQTSQEEKRLQFINNNNLQNFEQPKISPELFLLQQMLKNISNLSTQMQNFILLKQDSK